MRQKAGIRSPHAAGNIEVKPGHSLQDKKLISQSEPIAREHLRGYEARRRAPFKESEAGVRKAMGRVCLEMRKHQKGKFSVEAGGVSKALSPEQEKYITDLRASSVAVAELELANLQAGFPPGSRLPTIPRGAFDKNSKTIFGIGSYAPIREMTEVIDRAIKEREEHDEEGAKFGRCCVGQALNATMSMSRKDGKKVQTCLVDISVSTAVWKDPARTLQTNTKEFFASLNESTQSLLILTAFDLLEVLQGLRVSRDETEETPASFCMGAFAADFHRRYLVF